MAATTEMRWATLAKPNGVGRMVGSDGLGRMGQAVRAGPYRGSGCMGWVGKAVCGGLHGVCPCIVCLVFCLRRCGGMAIAINE